MSGSPFGHVYRQSKNIGAYLTSDLKLNHRLNTKMLWVIARLKGNLQIRLLTFTIGMERWLPEETIRIQVKSEATEKAGYFCGTITFLAQLNLLSIE